jgi:YcaO-like protein with predicted kinase domain
MGITRIADLTGLDSIGIPVAMAVRPRSLSVSVSQGKGLTLDQAKASAFMEAAELWHGEDLEGRARRWTMDEALCQGAPEPGDLDRTALPLDRQTSLPWIIGYDVLQLRPRPVPLELVATDFRRVSGYGDFFVATSDGLASGNHILEAMLAGLCEVVERSATAMWETQPIRARAGCRIDLASVDDGPCRAALDRLASAGFAAEAWDVTPALGIPVFICDLRPAERDPSSLSRTSRGSGCHPDRVVALLRALLEAAQVRLTHIAGTRDDIDEAAYVDDPAARAGGALLSALSAAWPGRGVRAGPCPASGDIGEEYRWCLGRLRAAGLSSCIAVDLTRAELGIPVVRTVVPGLAASMAMASPSGGPPP